MLKITYNSYKEKIENEISKVNSISELEEYIVGLTKEESLDKSIEWLISEVKNKKILGEEIIELLQRKKVDFLKLKGSLIKLNKYVKKFEGNSSNQKNSDLENILDALMSRKLNKNDMKDFCVILEGISYIDSKNINESTKQKIESIYKKVLGLSDQLDEDTLFDICYKYYEIMINNKI
ncbi:MULTISPECIES: hypothetical protein [Clostridium]|uniref:hypothetical protein n=1 Tax=Clostridium TaxID=1485 RepID=UPI0012ED56C2|nr:MULTISPECIES: hypothetical protein [Clostridium]MCD2346626.1 hypothetical protein [Clostridium guangxiense]